jgi:hypothetical protein
LEKLLGHIKTSSITTLILGIFALTWVVLDYFILKDVFASTTENQNVDKLLLIVSGVIFSIFLIATLINLYYVFRLLLKLRSDQRKNSPPRDNEDKD